MNIIYMKYNYDLNCPKQKHEIQHNVKSIEALWKKEKKTDIHTQKYSEEKYNFKFIIIYLIQYLILKS